MRRTRVTASSKARQKRQQTTRSFQSVAGFANDGTICRVYQRVPLASRADMVTGRAPIRRHRLATVGTWRADRGPENCPQVRPLFRALKQPQDLQSGSNALKISSLPPMISTRSHLLAQSSEPSWQHNSQRSVRADMTAESGCAPAALNPVAIGLLSAFGHT
jgi:hypothetical protein